jgi:hypothetical protein
VLVGGGGGDDPKSVREVTQPQREDVLAIALLGERPDAAVAVSRAMSHQPHDVDEESASGSVRGRARYGVDPILERRLTLVQERVRVDPFEAFDELIEV